MTAAAGDFAELEIWRAETAELAEVLAGLAEPGWARVTDFKAWRVFDHVHHLNISDALAAQAAADPVAFRARRDAVAVRGMAGGLGADGPPDISAADLFDRWRAGVGALGEALAGVEARARLPWYGPDMSARAFATARIMETWAHGQTIHDALGLTRKATDRLRPICELGWRTLGWSFGVRGLEAPVGAIALRLAAPSGVVWAWGADEAPERIEGPAEDFALVVCQCRNVADTRLKVAGRAAASWMAIAQCFVGGASDPPPPGTRGVRFLGDAA